MAVPKKKKSRAQTAVRRSAWGATLRAGSYVACPKCNEPMQPHRVCPSCGQYRGRQVVEKETSEA
ncbi:MAG TPA: 50S ribosomal protein L32 [Myxococcota bacterium]|jgi:large subunit ribosomal protein L32|nr:50S ribosomal protein L32 [Myxococcota bacterium]